MLPDAQVARFTRDLNAIVGESFAGRIGVAVSGGPDSLALLLLARAALPGRIEAATVDHGLRTASAGEAQFVAKLASDIGVRHSTLRIAKFRGGNLSAAARQARYAALTHWAGERGLDRLATAHHADDQLETLIMRLNRASGIAGLSAIRKQTGIVVRPLLGWRHDELVRIVLDYGITAVDDPANRDDRFDRARLRKMLRTADWLDPLAASRSVEAIAQANDAIDWASARIKKERVAIANGAVRFDPHGLPREIVRRLLLDCVRMIDAKAQPRGETVDRAIAALRRGRTLTLGNVRCSGGNFWTIAAAPPRRRTEPAES